MFFNTMTCTVCRTSSHLGVVPDWKEGAMPGGLPQAKRGSLSAEIQMQEGSILYHERAWYVAIPVSIQHHKCERIDV